MPDDNLSGRNALPAGAPQIVLDVVRMWDRLPTATQRAVTALLKALYPDIPDGKGVAASDKSP